VSELSS